MAKPNGNKKEIKAGDKKPLLKTTKPPKVRGAKPDFTPRKLRDVAPVVQTDMSHIWHGWSGVVAVGGVQFLVKSDKLPGAFGGEVNIPKVFVHSAPQRSPIHDISGSDVYLTVGQLRRNVFISRSVPGSKMYVIQKRIWDFLSKRLSEHGFYKQVPRPELNGVPEQEVSSSVAGLIDRKEGLYCFDEDGSPRAIFKVKFLPREGKEPALVAEVVSIGRGHPLKEFVRNGTYVFHNRLFWLAVPAFTGGTAGDQVKIWEYLTDRIAEHRKSSASTKKKEASSNVFYLGGRQVG